MMFRDGKYKRGFQGSRIGDVRQALLELLLGIANGPLIIITFVELIVVNSVEEDVQATALTQLRRQRVTMLRNRSGGLIAASGNTNLPIQCSMVYSVEVAVTRRIIISRSPRIGLITSTGGSMEVACGQIPAQRAEESLADPCPAKARARGKAKAKARQGEEREE